MTALLYGVAVAIATMAAFRSKCNLLKSLMVTLFVGWLVYANHPIPPVGFNIVLDTLLLITISSIFFLSKRCIYTSACHWIAAIFASMICLHIVHLVVDLRIYTYYLAYNILFLCQLVVVLTYSVVANGKNRASEVSTCQKTPKGSLRWRVRHIPYRKSYKITSSA